jgi:hypothetical protein
MSVDPHASVVKIVLFEAAGTDWLAIVNLVLAALSTIAWGVYVFFSVKTFREVKQQSQLQTDSLREIRAQTEELRRQTERQTRPHMLIDLDPENKVGGDCERSALMNKVEQRWRTILTTNIPAVEQSNTHVVLRLRNRGGGDITDWQLTVTYNIEPGSYLSTNFKTAGENGSFEIFPGGDHAILMANDQSGAIRVVVGPLTLFPVVQYDWSLWYRGHDGAEYSAYSGKNGLSDSNPLASPTAAPNPPNQPE